MNLPRPEPRQVEHSRACPRAAREPVGPRAARHAVNWKICPNQTYQYRALAIASATGSATKATVVAKPINLNFRLILVTPLLVID